MKRMPSKKVRKFWLYVSISFALYLFLVGLGSLYIYLETGDIYVESKGFRLKGNAALIIYLTLLMFGLTVTIMGLIGIRNINNEKDE